MINKRKARKTISARLIRISWITNMLNFFFSLEVRMVHIFLRMFLIHYLLFLIVKKHREKCKYHEAVLTFKNRFAKAIKQQHHDYETIETIFFLPGHFY